MYSICNFIEQLNNLYFEHVVKLKILNYLLPNFKKINTYKNLLLPQKHLLMAFAIIH